MDAKAKVVAVITKTGSLFKPESHDDLATLELEPQKLIPLTDHEAALAEKDGVLRQYAENVSSEMEDLLTQKRDAENRLSTLLTGLEALAGELERSGDCNRDSDGYAGYEGKVYDECAAKVRALVASAGLEGK